jgi:hypothetical protein
MEEAVVEVKDEVKEEEEEEEEAAAAAFERVR